MIHTEGRMNVTREDKELEVMQLEFSSPVSRREVQCGFFPEPAEETNSIKLNLDYF